MTRYVFEGTGEVWLVPTISSPGAPTAAELNAGTDLTGQMIGDLVLPLEGTPADSADMSSDFNSQVAGDVGGTPGSFTIHKEQLLAADTVYTALPRGTGGYLCVNQRALATPGTWATGDAVDVWPIEVSSRTIIYGRGNTQKAAIVVSITGAPTEDFVVVA
jgi:hypothetical protein